MSSHPSQGEGVIRPRPLSDLEWVDLDGDCQVFECQTDEGQLLVYLTEHPSCWSYEIDLGAMDGGTRLDPPEWRSIFQVTSPKTWYSREDAIWAALRHYARLLIIEQVAEDEMEEQMAEACAEQKRWDDGQYYEDAEIERYAWGRED